MSELIWVTKVAMYNLPVSHGRVAPDNVLVRPAHPSPYVMLIHGGGWLFTGKAALETKYASWFAGRGYGTYDVDYRPGVRSLADVVAAYDYLRRTVDKPVCVEGSSAGGSLALQLAVLRPSVRCVITEGAVVNITTMAPSFQATMRNAVLGNHLWNFSPLRVAKHIKQPVLMGGSTYDTVVPEVQQLAAMRKIRPATTTLLLPGATSSNPLDMNFTHASVTKPALVRWHRSELGFLAKSYKEAVSDY